MNEKLIVLSMDAMVREDVAYMMEKPNFRRLFAKSAQVEKVRSVFPAITYPAHTTLMTGCLPGTHGVYNNVPFKDYRDGRKHWYLDSKVIRVEDLFAAAKRAGCTTASVYWPICGNNPNIDYIINEYFFFYKDEDSLEAFRKCGASEQTLQVVKKNLTLLDKVRNGQDSFDSFINACACDLIRDYNPDVMLIHNCAPDSARHKSGVFGQHVYDALDRTDEWLGDLIEAMEETGTFEDTNFVLLSDHGQLNYTRCVRLNAMFARKGWVDIAPDGGVYDWQVFAQANGLSASVYLRDPGNRPLYDKVYAYLQELVQCGEYGFTNLYTTAEAKEKYGTYGPFCFMLATDGTTAFSEEWEGEDVIHYTKTTPATHGHEPEIGPQPIFLGRGPAFRENVMLPTAGLEDMAPTLAAVLGQTMPQAQGHCLKELLS